MDLRRNLRFNSVVQLLAVILIVGFVNHLGARNFTRLDLTEDRVHTLSQTGRALMVRLERTLTVKVYFTKGLEAPYNNHEQILVDKLEELRAWSRGRLDLQVIDPTQDKDLQEEAARLGVQPVEYAFKGENRQELKKVWMGVAFLYGERQTALSAVTQVETVEYDLARVIKSLLDEERKQLGWLVGHEEPDLFQGRGPLETLRDELGKAYELVPVNLGAEDPPPEGLDALLVVGPQGQVGVAEQFRLDQLLMSGVPVAFFLSNYKPDLRTLRAQPVLHGLEGLIGSYGLELNRDLVADRVSNGKMRFPVRQANYIVQVPINHPLIPLVTDLTRSSPAVRDLDSMQFPFVSSVDLPKEPPAGVEIEVMARAGSQAGRIKNVVRIDPNSYQRRDPSEEVGAWPLLVSAHGSFKSYFAGRELPSTVAPDEAAARVNESAPTRVIVAGSADFIANNITFMINLVDWMAQDEELIAIRSKTIQMPTLRPLEPGERRLLQAGNLLGGAALLWAFGALRRLLRRR